MVDRIRKFQILNDQIFSIVNKYLSDGIDSLPDTPIVHMEPPQIELQIDPSIADLPAGARESVAWWGVGKMGGAFHHNVLIGQLAGSRSRGSL